MKKTIYTITAVALFMESCAGTKNEVSAEEKAQVEQIETTVNSVNDAIKEVETSKADLENALGELGLE